MFRRLRSRHACCALLCLIRCAWCRPGRMAPCSAFHPLVKVLMKYVALIAGILLGLLFLVVSVPVLLHMKMPEPTGMPDLAIKFNEVFAASGWLMAVKVCECLGGLLVLFPRTRNLGLLVLVPIILNIILVNLLIMGSGPKILLLLVLPAILVIYERKAWLGLVATNRV